nr:HD domain-containing protein [Candidatus Sigynarchaeota archaeon]
MLESLEPKLLDIINRYFPDSLSHGKFHVLRVVMLSKRLQAEVAKHHGQEADLDILVAAAYLHDIGRLDNVKPLVDAEPPLDLPHASRSAALAREILSKEPRFPATKIPAVEKTIIAHSFSKGEIPATIEEKILSDADKLDTIGAQGIIRTIAYSVEHGRSIQDTLDHFNDKILKLKDLLYTAPAKKMAIEKHAIVEKFVKDLAQDLRDVVNLAATSSR